MVLHEIVSIISLGVEYDMEVIGRTTTSSGYYTTSDIICRVLALLIMNHDQIVEISPPNQVFKQVRIYFCG